MMTPKLRRVLAFNKFLRICEHNEFKEIVAFNENNNLVYECKFNNVTLKYSIKEAKMLCRIEFQNYVKMSKARENREGFS